jgi:hypothetical protein
MGRDAEQAEARKQDKKNTGIKPRRRPAASFSCVAFPEADRSADASTAHGSLP